MSRTRNSWNGLLAPDEKILWQGQPCRAIDWRALLSPLTLMGAFFTSFSLFWIAMAASMTAGSGAPVLFRAFPLFGLPFLVLGLWMLGGRVVLDAWLRGRTWYTLSSQTVFTARDVFARKTLESWPLRDIERIVLEDGQPGAVIFHLKGSTGVHQGGNARPIRPVGFHQIDSAQQVYSLMRKARRMLREGAE